MISFFPFGRSRRNLSARKTPARKFLATLERLETRDLLSGTPGYRVETAAVGTDTVYRLFLDDYQFGRITRKTDGDVIQQFRPDKGDANGWGTSEHIASFLTTGKATRGTIDHVTASLTGISAFVTGAIDTGASTFGTWSWDETITYDSASQRALGAGVRNISLPGPLSSAGASLALSKLSSNLLTNVHLQTGFDDNSGDMQSVHVSYAASGDPAHDFTWSGNPDTNSPTFASNFLSIDVAGQLNAVKATGVKVALKPDYKLQITSTSTPMIVDMAYDTANSKNRNASNVAVSPKVTTSVTATSMSFNFTVEASKPELTRFSDDFSRTDKGTGHEDKTVNVGRKDSNHAPWVLKSGSLVISSGKLKAGSKSSETSVSGLRGKDVSASAVVDLRGNHSSKVAGIKLRGGYRALVSASGSSYTVTLRIQVLRNGSWKTLASVKSKPASGRLDFSITGNTLRVHYGPRTLVASDSTYTASGPVSVILQNASMQSFAAGVRTA